MSKLEKILSLGLAEGYAGKTKFSKILRGIFPFKRSISKQQEGEYHDEWTSSDILGGGQELAYDLKSGQTETRLYYGGTLTEDQLLELGVSIDLVIAKLKEYILEFGEKTRLRENCLSKIDDGWQYEYLVTLRDDEFSSTIGIETITFNNTPVFRHYFMLGPVK